MHYLFKAATPDEGQQDSEAGDEIKLITPKRWVTKVNPRWDQSSFELHDGLEVSEDERDTVPAELFNEMFKPTL
jgi:hypothetical protein